MILISSSEGKIKAGTTNPPAPSREKVGMGVLSPYTYSQIISSTPPPIKGRPTCLKYSGDSLPGLVFWGDAPPPTQRTLEIISSFLEQPVTGPVLLEYLERVLLFQNFHPQVPAHFTYLEAQLRPPTMPPMSLSGLLALEHP